ncbi:hypothetical protein L13192_08662 [Pyrenophora tritici-repentis]|nr:hypothetical protein L13192_08662 [Pyrenophora tritici-repentis]
MPTSRPQKCQREDEPVEPSKRQRQQTSRSLAPEQQHFPNEDLHMSYIDHMAMNRSPYRPSAPPSPPSASHQAPKKSMKNSHISHQAPDQRIELPSAASASSPNPSAPSDTDDSAQIQLFALQKQWLEAAKDDLQPRLITKVPGIEKQHWLVGSKMPSDKDLVPSHIWHLRSFQPSKRYVAYQHLSLLARNMIKHDQRSKEYQTLWTAISSFRIRLVQHERDWLASVKKSTPEEIVERLKRIGYEQAINTMVTKAMVDEFDKYQKARLPALSNAHQGAQTTQPQTLPAVQAPSEHNKSEKNSKVSSKSPLQSPLAPATTAQPARQNPSVKPDKVKYPNDLVRVPEYPLDHISDYTPNSETGMYKCRHPHETKQSCCQTGLTENKMRASIQKEIFSWRGRVEMLIHKGELDPRHKTWDRTCNVTLKKQEQAAAERLATQKAKEDAEERVAKARQERRKEKRLQQAAKAKEDEKKRQKEVDEAIAAGREPPAPVTKQPGVNGKGITTDAKAAALKKHMRLHQDCQALESRKKWPNWDRFDAWWDVKRLRVEGAALSAEQRALLQEPEPSALSDKDPNFLKKKAAEKKAEEKRSNQEANKENVVTEVEVVEDDELDDLFEDDKL